MKTKILLVLAGVQEAAADMGYKQSSSDGQTPERHPCWTFLLHNLTEIFWFAKNCFTSPTELAASQFVGRGEW